MSVQWTGRPPGAPGYPANSVAATLEMVPIFNPATGELMDTEYRIETPNGGVRRLNEQEVIGFLVMVLESEDHYPHSCHNDPLQQGVCRDIRRLVLEVSRG